MRQNPRLVLNGVDVDLRANEPVITDIAAFQIDKPEIRKGIVTRTIQVDGTDNNSALFGLLYKWDIFSSTFDPTIRIPAELYSGGTIILVGYCQLIKCTEQSGIITFDLALFGSVTDLMQQASTFELTDLDFSDLNHVWNDTNVVDTWDALTIGFQVGYHYPMIDYGQLPVNDRQNTPPSSISYDVTDFYPSIWLHEYVKRIADACSVTIVSDFFNTDKFKRIAVPYGYNNVPQLPASETIKSLYQAGVQHYDIGFTVPDLVGYSYVDRVTPVYGLSLMNDDTTGDYFDGSTVYNTTTKRFTANRGGKYSFGVQVAAYLGYQHAKLSNDENLRITIELYKNGTLADSAFVDYQDNEYYWDVVTSTGTPKLIIQNALFEQSGVSIGDYFEVKISLQVIILNPYSTYGWIFWAVSDQLDKQNCTWWKNQRLVNTMDVGDTWDMNAIQPKGIKASDVLSLITTMFNLVWEADSLDKSIVYVEPYDAYYEGGSVTDWTDKIDLSKARITTPTANKAPKTFRLSYKEGNGYFDKGYLQKYGYTYGSIRLNINSGWATGYQERSSVAIAPVSAGYTSSGRIYPRFFDIGQSGDIVQQSGGFRIAYCDMLPIYGVAGEFVFNGTPRPYYPYAGHLDNPYNPTFDLLFDVPKEVYWSSNKETGVIMRYTNANLYNLYWRNYLLQMYSPESLTVSAYFMLNPFDIQQFRFNNEVIVAGVKYRVLSINGYSSDSIESVRVEMQRVIEVAPFIEVVKDLNGGDGDTLGGSPLPATIEK